MAKFFPDVKKENITFMSHGEKLFYEQCAVSLSDEWTVHYSVVLSRKEQDRGVRDNEMDFILYHPRHGLVVAEVKGGKISYNPTQRKFYSENRYGKVFGIKNPFQQSQAFKGRLISALSFDKIRVPVSYMVVLPDIDSEFLGNASFQSMETVVHRGHFEQLESKIKQIVSQSQPERFMKFKDQKNEINHFFNGKYFKAEVNLRDYIELQSERVTDIELIQSSFITPIASQKRVAIEGEAGTGKTLLASQLAKHFSVEQTGSDSKNILFLSPNEYVNRQLIEDLPKNVTVKTFLELSKDFGIDLLKQPTETTSIDETSKDDWQQFKAPELLMEKIQKGSLRYDVIISDESQDIQPLWWEPIESLLSGDDSNLYVFFDRNQGVFAQDEFEPESVLPKVNSFFPLVQNYRTTKEISQFAEKFKPESASFKNHVDRIGMVPKVITYKNTADAQAKLTELMKELDSQGLRSGDLAVLSARKTDHEVSVLSGIQKLGPYKIDHLQKRKSKQKELYQKNSLLCSTVQGFKGLECEVGVLINIDENKLSLDNALFKSLMYVAATRAKHMLYVFVQEKSEKSDRIHKIVDNIESIGSIVVDKNQETSNHLESGIITYYDPQRFGLVQVASMASSSTNEVLFFPNDLDVTIGVGDRVKFRLKNVQGKMAIAFDLKIVSEAASQENSEPVELVG